MSLYEGERGDAVDLTEGDLVDLADGFGAGSRSLKVGAILTFLSSPFAYPKVKTISPDPPIKRNHI